METKWKQNRVIETITIYFTTSLTYLLKETEDNASETEITKY